MIHTYIPYAPKELKRNLGATYNSFMAMLPDGDWACFLDHDAMFTTSDWYPQLESIVNELPETKPEAGILTACTNRIGNDEQIIFRKSSREALDHDIRFHRAIGKKRQDDFGLSLREAHNHISGVVILISKTVWAKTSGFKDGFLGVDIDIDRQIRSIGYKTYIMDGVYCYHYYRAENGREQARGYSPSKNLPPIVLEGYKRDLARNAAKNAIWYINRFAKNFRS